MATKPQTKSSIYEYLKSNPYINMGWTTFHVIFRDSPKLEGENCLGYCDFDSHEVVLKSKLDNSRICKEVVTHEIYHLIFETVGFGTCHMEGDHVETENEKLTTQASRGTLLFQALNPELFKVIFHDSE